MRRQGRYPRRQGLHHIKGRQHRPARGAIGINLGGAQIVGQSRPKRLFKAHFHLQAVHNLATLDRVTLQQPRQCRDLGAQRVQFPLGFAAFGTHICLARLCCGARGLGLGQDIIGLGHRHKRLFLGGAGLPQLGFGLGQTGARMLHGGTGGIGLGLAARQNLGAFFQKAVCRLVARGQTRHIFGALG